MVGGEEQKALECIREIFGRGITLQMVYRKYQKQPRKKNGNEAKHMPM